MPQQFWKIIGIADITGLAHNCCYFDRISLEDFTSKAANSEGKSPVDARMAAGL